MGCTNSLDGDTLPGFEAFEGVITETYEVTPLQRTLPRLVGG